MDACICQTLTASPAQPGELPGELATSPRKFTVAR